jgi:hypothetical protein
MWFIEMENIVLKLRYFFVKFEKEGQKTNNHKMSQFVDLHHL